MSMKIVKISGPADGHGLGQKQVMSIKHSHIGVREEMLAVPLSTYRYNW